mgnify:CR=1 FL=1
MGSNEIYTIGREFGSLGKQVGQELAKRLGIKFYDKELLQKAAKESGLCEEIFESHDEKLFIFACHGHLHRWLLFHSTVS